MAVRQNVTKYKDVYTLYNVGVTSFSYSLLLIDCGEATQVVEGSLIASGGVLLPMSKDGNYELTVWDESESTVINYRTRKNLLLSIVKSIKKSLCDCKCKNCDCEEEEVSCNLHKIMSYIIAKPEINNVVKLISPYFDCRLKEGSDCTVANEIIYGKNNCIDLEKNLLSLYYLSIYLYEVCHSNDPDEDLYVSSIMNYKELQKCISLLGISILEIKKLLLNYNV